MKGISEYLEKTGASLRKAERQEKKFKVDIRMWRIKGIFSHEGTKNTK